MIVKKMNQNQTPKEMKQDRKAPTNVPTANKVNPMANKVVPVAPSPHTSPGGEPKFTYRRAGTQPRLALKIED